MITFDHHLRLISIQCNLGSCHVERISLDMADCQHFKRKESQNSARSLNCNEWKSALTEAIIVTADVHLTVTYVFFELFPQDYHVFYMFRPDHEYRYVYFNHMNLAQKTTMHSKKQNQMCVSPEIIKIICDINADFAR